MKTLLTFMILSLLACEKKQVTQSYKVDRGLTNSNFNPDANPTLPDQENIDSNGSNSINKPDSSSVRGEWEGNFSSLAKIQLDSFGGETLDFDRLQNDKDFLVIGLYKTDCPQCIEKAKIFIESKNKGFFQNSKTCQYVGIIQGDPSSNATLNQFALEYGFQFQGSAKDDIKQSPLASKILGGNFDFPTTIVIDFDGDIIKSFNKDLGPQTALSYCQ